MSHLHNDELEVRGIEIDSKLHIVSADGEVLENAWALGTICEGTKFYTYIVPRPYVNSTALIDADRTVGELFAKAQQSPVSPERSMAHVTV